MRLVMLTCFVFALIAVACSSDNGPPPGAGNGCPSAASCYPGVNPATVHGAITCLTQVQGGYCTHSCATNSDCCVTAAECPSGLVEVCSPFESAGQTYCLISCSATDIANSPNGGPSDPSAFCKQYAGANFTCRSSGGGHANQQFCGP